MPLPPSSVSPFDPAHAPPLDPLDVGGTRPPQAAQPARVAAQPHADEPRAASVGPPRPADGRPGHQVVLALFVVLALCTVFVFTVFAAAVRPEDREWLPELTARYLYMPVVATGVLVAIDAWRAKAQRWWLLFLASPVPFVNVALAVAWILKWRHAQPRWLAGP